MPRKRRVKATEFTKNEREIINSRDGGCIFCQMNYYNNELNSFEKSNFQIMHYIPRSQGGLGIRENAAVGCIGHHTMFDNGSSGRREEMKERFKKYLKSFYPDWNENNLVFNKYKD